jgi:hypothetical protein
MADAELRPGAALRVVETLPPDFFDGLAESLVIDPGDRVTVLPGDSVTWPAYALVANARGERGWVPKRFLRQDGEQVVTTHHFDTVTLTPAAGDILRLIESDLEGGWLWCSDSRNRVGWYPVTMVEPVDQ